MKKLHLTIIFLACLALLLYACEKEAVDPNKLAITKFVGRWPVKVHIEIVKKNNDTMSNDTVKLSPIDTVAYTADGKYIKKTDTIGYSVDAAGENITYATKPSPTAWKIKWLRVTSIILSQEKTQKIGADTFVYYTEEQLIK